jgi:hypothetical protein
MAAPSVRYRVALDLTPETFDLAHELVRSVRVSGRNPFGQALDVELVLRLAVSLGLTELAKMMEEPAPEPVSTTRGRVAAPSHR